MGKLIVIEGVDSSGKETQANLLYDSLKEAGNVIQVSFPDYDSDFCMPVKRYLAGDLGNAPDDVNAFAASAFYAIDRFASFKRGEWGSVYRTGGTVIADRYAVSYTHLDVYKRQDSITPRNLLLPYLGVRSWFCSSSHLYRNQ